MKTDSLYYEIFATAPSIFFDLIGQPVSSDHRFDSVEVKQTAFRIDGVFLPEPDARDRTVYFVEVQFQSDDALYQRLFAEIALFLRYHPDTPSWRAIVFFPRRSLEPPQLPAYESFLALPNVTRIYLDEPPAFDEEPFAWRLMRLIVAPAKRAFEQAKQLVQTASSEFDDESTLIELVETAMVYKFPDLTIEEITKMLGMATKASQTRVFQDGRVEGERAIVLRQLGRKVGEVPSELISTIESLPVETLESLGDALLDFETLDDLRIWLQTNA